MTASSYASDAKITEALAVLGADLIGQTEQTLLQQLVVAAALGGGGGGGGAATWGTITGTLSAQTDLQSALDAKLNLTGGTLTGQLIQSANGAASTPPVLINGTVFTGGTATTTKPALLIEPAGTTSNNWNTNGTGFGVNLPSGSTADIFNGQLNAADRFKVDSTGRGYFSGGSYNVPWISTLGGVLGIGAGNGSIMQLITNGGERVAINENYFEMAGTMYLGWGSGSTVGNGGLADAFFQRAAAATIQMGSNHATTATNQTFKAHDVTTGAGADLILEGGAGSANDGYVKIGTAKGGLAFFGAAGSPLISGSTNTNISSGGAGSALLDDTQSDGGLAGGAYTFGGLVAALKSYGIIG